MSRLVRRFGLNRRFSCKIEGMMGNLKLALVAVFGGLLVVGLMAFGLSRVSDKGGVLGASVEELTDGARFVASRGEKRVVVVEFSDLQCPACRAAQPVSKKLKEIEGVELYYRHFPLLAVHPNAWKAARAAEAARILGKGWEMIDLLFEEQTNWANLGKVDEIFVSLAKSLGLDEKLFIEKYESEETDKAVATDFALANRLKLSGTPTFFVNGEQVAANFVLDKVKQALGNGN